MRLFKEISAKKNIGPNKSTDISGTPIFHLSADIFPLLVYR